MDFEDCEYLAEDTPIEIVPNFNSEPFALVSGSVGPFTPTVPLVVPLWLGMYLKRRHKCSVIAPDWLNTENLKKYLVAESEIATLSKVPEHYVEIAKVLLGKAGDDIENSDQLMTLVTDLKDKRTSKMRTDIQKYSSQADTCHAVLNNLTRLEAAHFRPYLEEVSTSIDVLNEHRHVLKQRSND